MQHRYRVEAVLGSGGAATTYSADDEVMGRRVAIKVLHDASEPLRVSLTGELQRLRGLVHPNLARVHDLASDVIESKRVWFLVSQFIDGVTLAAHSTNATWDTLYEPVRDALRALEFLHRVGTRHGDVKPDNVLVAADGRGVLIDLGCARPLKSEADLAPTGTPLWMAPEVLQGDPADERADLYALGKSLLTLPVSYPASVRALLTAMCDPRLKQRPSNAAEVLERLGDRERQSRTAGIRSDRLLERDHVLSRFGELLDACDQDVAAPRALVVHGHAGIGRTRMLQELKWRAQERCDVAEGNALVRAGLAELFGRAVSSDAIPLGLPALIDARNRLTQSSAPLVLILDDTQLLSDSESEALLGLLRTTTDRGRLLLVLGATEPPRVDNGAMEQIEITPLSRAALQAWTSGRLDASSVDALLRHTGGVPAAFQRALDALSAGTLREADLLGASPATLAAALGSAASAPETETVSDEEILRIDAIESLAQAGAWRDGANALRELSTSTLRYPRRLLRAAEQIGNESETEAGVAHAVAVVALSAGEPARALHWIGRALRRRPDKFSAVEARCLAADAYTRLGAPRRSRQQLLRARPDANDDQQGAVAERLARALSQQGQHEQAAEVARDALSQHGNASIRARLHEALGVACLYLGDRAAASRALTEAERLNAPDDIRAQFRCLSYRAMLDFRDGNPTDAATRYASALRLADQHGLADLYVNAALNLGSVSHQLGDLGPALATYERGIELCRALGKQSTRASLMFNVANLYTEIGAFERAEGWLRAAEELTRAADLGSLHPYLVRLRGELADAHHNDIPLAEARFKESRDGFREAGSRREVAELSLELARLHLHSGHLDSCAAFLDDADRQLAGLAADDVVAQARGLRAQLWLRSSRGNEALPLLESALAHAERRTLRLLLAELHHDMADLYTALDASELAHRHRDLAVATDQRVATSLPVALRDTFFGHPKRRRRESARSVQALNTPPVAAAQQPTTARFDLSGFLEVNRRINSSLSVEQVLSHAMDAAIALTGAERGFLLLRDDNSEVDVEVARNVDREHLGKAHAKFSRSIADEVIHTGEPLLTVDAGNDSRFADQKSVHSMKLKSVVCVPIRSPRGILGALYLDNRFARARFRQEDVDVLVAFSDQVAIAITNARLHAQLEQRTRELEAERKRVERLAQGQAIEIDRLKDALDTQQHALELRHDYSSLVARSGAMRGVLRTLDRVTDSHLSVLIQGESGTGKEVVARALHFNGPRRKQPFVSINCGALPEPLLESELFGHVRGAFTGADRDRPGLFLTARGGTLFLDEIAEMSAGMQVKLLRVLQEHEVRPVGSSRTERIDVRVLGATNRPLLDEVQAGRFREDLYYRIAVVEVTLPPLRERVEDIAELSSALLKRLSESSRRGMPKLSPDALQAIQGYPWPGNVRELENALSRALVMSAGGVIASQDLALATRGRRQRASSRRSFEAQEAANLLASLQAHRWNVSAVSRQLGIPRNTLYRKLKRYNLDRAVSGAN